MSTIDDLRKQATNQRQLAASDERERDRLQAQADSYARRRDEKLAKAQGLEDAIAVLEAAAEYQP